MTDSTVLLQRNPALQLGVAVVGTAAYCIYARSWRDATHLVYDIPANLAVFAFIGQLVLVLGQRGIGWVAGSHLVLLAVMTAVSAGRDFLKWDISGHLTCVLAVAIVQSADPRLSVVERLVYWIPLPIVLAIRWWVFDLGLHGQTYHALVVGLAAGLPVAVVTAVLAAR